MDVGELFTLETKKKSNEREMKKIEYKAPEMEVIKLISNNALLSMSSGAAPDPNEPEGI